MDNKKFKIIFAVIVLIIIVLVWWMIIREPATPITIEEPVPQKEIGFPATPQEVNWDDREIFKSGLTEGAQGVLDELPQASTYYISLEIGEVISDDISGHQMVRYFNAENEPLEEVYFRLFPNWHGGQMTVSNLMVKGEDAAINLESKNTALRVDLPQALNPGESVVIEMDFTLGVPTEMDETVGNYGLYGYFEDVLLLNTSYPMIPAFDDENGWYSGFPQPNGDHTYQDASFYVVQVTAPDDVVLASSGVSVDRQVDGDTQTVTFAAGPARDFYLAGSREFVELKETVGDLTVRVLTREEFDVHQGYALNIALEAIEILSQWVGDYPYTEFEIISAPMLALGIEYPGITHMNVSQFVAGGDINETPSEIYLESTTAHEVVHMWFYNAVGNDQQNDPWLDEALTQYFTYIYYLDNYGNGYGEGYIESWYGRWSRVEKEEIPIGLPAGEYYSEETRGLEYGAIVYGRGPIFFLELEQELGLDTLMAAIQNYYRDNLWGVAQPEDLLAALEDACGCDLDDMFNEWVYGN